MKLSILLILFGISQVLGGRKNLGTRQFCEKGQPDYSDGPQCSRTNQNCGPYGLCLLKATNNNNNKVVLFRKPG